MNKTSIRFAMVNRYFILEIVLPTLKKHMKWIEDEIENRPKEFKLFTLQNGVIKTIIRKTD